MEKAFYKLLTFQNERRYSNTDNFKGHNIHAILCTFLLVIIESPPSQLTIIPNLIHCFITVILY